MPDLGEVGSIGWDTYFIGSGLIQIILPTDLSALDEEGRRDIEKVKVKAASIGLVYRVGNHFGESSLISQSGVRQETTIATTTAELYLLTKEKLENIFSYMDPCERGKLRNNLLSRNGNVWHNFDDYNNIEESSSNPSPIDEGGTSPVTTSPKRMATQINKSFLSWVKPEQFTKAVSPNSRKAFVSHHRDENMRLRSFSAEASSDALRRKISYANVTTNNLIDGKGTWPLSAVNEIKKMVQAGKESQRDDANNSDSSSSYCRVTKQNSVWDPGS